MPKPRAHLTATKGEEIGRRYVIRAGQRFILGRGSDCNILLKDNLVSRHHAALELTHKGLSITDLGSRNGSKLDEKPMPAEQAEMACSGDILEAGNHALKIELFDIDEDTVRKINRTRKLPRNFLPTKEFELLGQIGRGATGIVYGAKQIGLQRNVAIKVPRTDVPDYEESRLRFIREGRLCCKIQSPHIVTVHDLRMYGDRVFIVMELVNGGSVHDRLAGPSLMSVSEIARIGCHVAQALHAMHRLEIIHRDIKPSNILLSPKGAKLTDFGIAKQLGEEGENLRRLTGSDEGLGTLGYVSPEAIMTKELSPLTDIYSLGATLYHMLTGVMPFASKTAPVSKVMHRIINEEIFPISTFRPKCPAKLAALVENMMAKNPEDRPQDAALVSVVLERFIELPDQHEPDSQTDQYITSMDSSPTEV